MKTIYTTTIIGEDNHASIEIPEKNLAEIGANKRAPLKITINNYTYQSTATGVNGMCRVVFPMADRQAAGVSAGDIVQVTLELDSGYREVDIPKELMLSLENASLVTVFRNQIYSRRKEFARQVFEAKAPETKVRRIAKILDFLAKSKDE